MSKTKPVGPARDYEGMHTDTTVADQEALIRKGIDELRKTWDHGPGKGGGGLRSSRSAQLAVRQELGIDAKWNVIFDLLVMRVVAQTRRDPE